MMSCGLLSTNPSEVTVYIGRHAQEEPNSQEEVRSALLVIKHPSYNERTKDGDLALLKLSSPVTFSDFIRPVCLAGQESFFPDGLEVWATGWGRILSDGKISGKPLIIIIIHPSSELIGLI